MYDLSSRMSPSLFAGSLLRLGGTHCVCDRRNIGQAMPGFEMAVRLRRSIIGWKKNFLLPF